MSSYVLIRAGRVSEVFNAIEDQNGQPLFHPEFVAQIVEVDGEPPTAGDDAALVDGRWQFSATPPPTVDLVAYAREARWRAEVGGMVWNGVPIATDDNSKLKITGARLAAQANPGFETTWWGMDGEGVVVDAPLIIQLSDAVLTHVDGTFTTFGQVKAAIAARTITTREEIDAAFA